MLSIYGVVTHFSVSRSSMTTSSPFFFHVLGAVVLGLCVVWTGGCDSVPDLEQGERHSPSVFALQIDPDSVHGNDLAPEQEAIGMHLSVKATDRDGRIDRVLFTLEPASNPRGTAFGQLEPTDSIQHGYAQSLSLSIPTTIDEIYTVRVFAVDEDSLTSNQVTGQLRFVPADTSEAEGDLRRVESSRPSPVGPGLSTAHLYRD